MKVSRVLGRWWFLVSLGALSCTSLTVDRKDTFWIQAEVRSESGSPVEGAQVYFIDSGMDDWRRGEVTSDLLATSDAEGKLGTSYEYWWGYHVRGRRLRPPSSGEERRFAILITKPGYAPFRASFVLHALQKQDDGASKVDLGRVVLRKQTSPSR